MRIAWKNGIGSRKNQRDGLTYYYILYRDPQGTRRRERAGTTRRDAERLLAKRRGAVVNGTWKDPNEETEAGVTTFAQLAERFLADYASHARSGYYSHMVKSLVANFGDRELAKIRPLHIDAFRDERLRSERVGRSTVRKELTVLGTMFRTAKWWGLIPDNPVEGVKKPSEPQHRTRFLTADEWVTLQRAAPRSLRPLLTLAVSTGARLKELSRLRWEDVDFRRGRLHITGSKIESHREFPIGETAREVLDELHRGGPEKLPAAYVLVDSDGQSFDSDQKRNRVSQRTRALAKRIGLEGVTLHTLRHTAASWMIQNGVSLEDIRKILGHANPQTTMRYAHLKPEHLADTLTAVDRVIASAGSSRFGAPPEGPANDASKVLAHKPRSDRYLQ